MTRTLPRLVGLVLTLVTTFAAGAAPGPASAPATLDGAAFLTSPGGDWKLRFNDEFNGDALDTRTWSIGLPWGGTDGEGRHHNDLYASYIVDRNVEVAGGALRLLTRREDVKDKKGRTFHFTEGLITSAKSFRHRFGYWEARVRLPVEAGPGLWPAFWTLAQGWPPEMDICEIWTSSNRSHQGFCYRPRGGAGRAEGGRERWDEINTYTPLPTGWTTYGMEWGPGYQIYNIDGRINHHAFGDHVNADEHYILLNSGVESGSKPTSATVFPNAFEVDYVRVYTRPDLAIVHNGSFEDPARAPWGKSGQVAVVAYGAHDGKHALRVDGPSATSEQKLFGLRPGTTYVLSGRARLLTDSGEARLGVKDHGGAEAFARVSGREYAGAELEFKTGSDATTAVVYCYLPGDGAALFDHVTIRRK